MPSRRDMLKAAAATAAVMAGWGRALASPPQIATETAADEKKQAAGETGDAAFYAALTAMTAEAPSVRLARLDKFPPQWLSPTAQDEWLAVAEAAIRDAALARFDFGIKEGVPSPYVVTQRAGAWQKVTPGTDDPALAQAIDAESAAIRRDAGRGVTPPDFILMRMVDKLGTAAGAAGGVVREALGRQMVLMQSLPKRTQAGVWALPGGEAYYALALAAGAAGTVAPEDAHKQAWDEIAKINARLEPLLQAQGLTDGTVGARLHRLGQDTRYLYAASDAGRAAALADMNGWLAAARPVLPRAFSWLPQNVSVQLAHGRNGWREAPTYDGRTAGTYYVDLRAIHLRPRWSLKTVVHHETLPGHLLQLPLQERAAPPPLRVRATAMAYSEGWPTYGEELCAALGLFDGDPLGEIGLWQSILVRLARQVADTGLHALRWSREKTLSTMADIAGDFPDPLAAEVDRIAIQPGLMAGQSIGRTVLWQARRKLQNARGPRFDEKAFHDMVLNRGPLPQAILARLTDRFVAENRG